MPFRHMLFCFSSVTGTCKNILKVYPVNVYELLANPIAVNVANPEACLKATGIIQVPIKWENGIETCFKMLVALGLAWLILFGENHLKQTKSIIDHDKLSMYFGHVDMKFTVSCRRENSTMAFSSLKSHDIRPKIPSATTTHSATSNITCLLTGLPSPSHMRKRPTLQRGFNSITVCLLLTSSMIGYSFTGNDLWLQGETLSPGIEVLSGPVSLNKLGKFTSPLTFEKEMSLMSSSRTSANFVNTKCCSSKPIPEPETKELNSSIYQAHVYDGDKTPLAIEDLKFPDCTEIFYATVEVKCNRPKTSIPFNAELGIIHPVSNEDNNEFIDAANNTPKHLADSWLHWFEMKEKFSEPDLENSPSHFGNSPPKSWQISAQNLELKEAGLKLKFGHFKTI